MVGDADGVTVDRARQGRRDAAAGAEKVATETKRIAEIKSRKALRPAWLDGALRAAGVHQGRGDAVSYPRSSSPVPTWRRRRWPCWRTTRSSTPARRRHEDDIVALCKRHDPVAIIVRYSKVGAAAMDAAPCLKVISKHGSGTDTIDKVAAQARGIEVRRRGRRQRRGRGGAGAGAAAGLRQVGRAARTSACMPATGTRPRTRASSCDGRTVGVVGLGAIGLRFARMADAMGMRVLGFDPYAKNLPTYIEAMDLATIWREVRRDLAALPADRGQREAASMRRRWALCKRGRDRGQHRARRADRRSRAARSGARPARC